MAAKWIELVTGSLDEKKAYRQLKERQKRLPSPYLETAGAIERYLMSVGGVAESKALLDMYRDLIELMEQSAADATPVRDIVGDDPVEFVETFIASYTGKTWMDKERMRLRDAIDRADTQGGTS
ncbi:DUF1048 domain-containing protein [Microbacterium karelineae]|uniref:DUF1048 domain-containing protein n=1 Tax=Microbacterium karelineae TaxID=2654283 RepID=UPI0012EACFAD|nr:DUF1048 domain-containing protein [Microbacterium karelineae]